jgi:hypothetical protein
MVLGKKFLGSNESNIFRCLWDHGVKRIRNFIGDKVMGHIPVEANVNFHQRLVTIGM